MGKSDLTTCWKLRRSRFRVILFRARTRVSIPRKEMIGVKRFLPVLIYRQISTDCILNQHPHWIVYHHLAALLLYILKQIKVSKTKNRNPVTMFWLQTNHGRSWQAAKTNWMTMALALLTHIARCFVHSTNEGVRKMKLGLLKMLMTVSLWEMTSYIRQVMNSWTNWKTKGTEKQAIF